MANTKITGLAFIAFSVILSGCMLPVTRPKMFDCPAPSQNCNPLTWTGIAMDTSIESSRLTGFYYIIEMVKQVNSPDDEWCFSFLDNKKAALTFTDINKQNVILMTMIKPNKFSLESGLYIPIEGSSGSLSVRGNKVVFSSVSNNPADYEEAEIEKYEERKKDVFENLGESKFNERYGIELRDENVITLIKMPNEYIIGNSNLFYADLSANQLKNAVNLGSNVHYGNFSWESQPALTPDGNVVFFSSDRQGGIGGTDIWFTVRQPDGSWSQPINAGPTINSKCDELTPFIAQDGKKMYFSSCGHENVGGYDIFSADFSEAFSKDIRKNDLLLLASRDYFEKRRNLRPPLNTPYDELFPSSPGDCDSILYYSSNQYASSTSLIERKGGFDIFVRYKVKSPYAEEIAAKRRDKVDIAFGDEPTLISTEPNLTNVPLYTLEGRVFNSSTNQPISDAEVVVRELPSYTIKTQTETKDDGKYRVDLEKDREFEVTAQAKDLFFDSFKLRVDNDDPTASVKHDFYLPIKFELRVNFPLNKYNDPYRYTLDSNGIETSRTWKDEINLLVENINLSKDKVQKIILVGHTDYLSSIEYNQSLGQKRVDFIIGELIKRGVPESLLEGRSAGELEPLPKRQGEDEKLYRKRLRRVTLEKVMKL